MRANAVSRRCAGAAQSRIITSSHRINQRRLSAVSATRGIELRLAGEAEYNRRRRPRDPITRLSHSRYHKSHGNLAEMTRLDWNEFFERAMLWLWWSVVLPSIGIFAAFDFGGDTLGAWLLRIYTALVTVVIGVKFLGFAIRLAARLAGKVDPRAKMFQLWDQMHEVWKRLEGPIVNPSRVREAMVKSAEHGAVWNTASWSLIDRMIAVDPAVWVVRQPH
jgi:hypothetical protein